MYNVIAITGANSGLGAELVKALSPYDKNIVIPINGPGLEGFDFCIREDVYAAGERIRFQTDAICNDLGIAAKDTYRILINCAGVNYIEWFDQAVWSQYDRLNAINVVAPILLTQELIGLKPPCPPWDGQNWFQESGAVVNVISNASHVAMTNSVFYNSTKGALHIATLAMARELRKTHGLCVFGVSPNKLHSTGMSDYIEQRVPGLRGWTPEQAAAYQLAALPAGEETDPAELAEFLSYLLSTPKRHKYLTNTVLPYGA